MEIGYPIEEFELLESINSINANEETKTALFEAALDQNLIKYNSVDEMMKDLGLRD